MDNDNKLHVYITQAYRRWVDYARHYIQRSKLPIEASEVVDEVLCALLERDVERLERMLGVPAKGGTELDFFIMRIIKTSIYSPRSPFRYQRGQHCTGRLKYDVPMAETESDSGHDEVCTLVWQMLPALDATELEKRVFIWKFFDGNPISKWPGPENKRMLYRAYNRIFRKIASEVRCKIGC